MVDAMSPQTPPARMLPSPVSAGRMAWWVGVLAASITSTIITTGTGTNGSGWVSVRR